MPHRSKDTPRRKRVPGRRVLPEFAVTVAPPAARPPPGAPFAACGRPPAQGKRLRRSDRSDRLNQVRAAGEVDSQNIHGQFHQLLVHRGAVVEINVERQLEFAARLSVPCRALEAKLPATAQICANHRRVAGSRARQFVSVRLLIVTALRFPAPESPHSIARAPPASRVHARRHYRTARKAKTSPACRARSRRA